MEFLLDTTFIIDLERENAFQNKINPAGEFLKQHKSAHFEICMITVGEFSEGFLENERSKFFSYIMMFNVLPIDIEVSWLFGQWARVLRKKGTTLGANDLWIACCALRHQRSVVTRNMKDFSRISGLSVVSY